jgi:hypothetical protein
MKLYGDFQKEDWLKILGLSEKDIPNSFIIHGEWIFEDNLKLWREILCKEVHMPKWNTLIGRYKKFNVGYANVYGSSMTPNIVHQFACSDSEVFIQTGYFGGLSSKVKYGDILIVTAAEMKDGVSHWYLPGQTVVESDKELVEAACEYCEQRGYRYVKGNVVSMGAMLMETYEMVKGWSIKGYDGVDMETATTLAIANRFNKRAIGLLNLSDHIIHGDTLYSYTQDRELIEAETDRAIRDVALYLSEKFQGKHSR